MADRRDEQIATALRELHVPEHGPGFWAELERRLEAESRPRLVAEPRRERPRFSLRLGFAAAAAVALAVVAIVALRTATLGPERASAAEIVRSALSALGSAESVSGTLVVEGPNDEGGGTFVYRKRFLIEADGSFRGEQIPAPSGVRRSEQALDAPRGVAYDVSVPAPGYGPPMSLESTGVPLGGPDQGPLVDELNRQLSWTALALVDTGDARVSEIAYEGRAAWELSSPIRYGADTPGHIHAVIDMQTALPVETTIKVDREPDASRMSIRDLAVDVPVSPADFRLQPPPGTNFLHQDFGFRRTDLAGAAERAGYAPPVPGFIPRGFALDAVAVLVPEQTCIADCDPGFDPTPTGVELSNPVAGPIIALSYRDGLRQFVVTARPTGPRPDLWQDPFVPDTLAPNTEPIRLDRGRFAGARGQIVIDPLAEPHLWALDDQLVVTVGGSLTASELVAIANSLRDGE
jgi:outer membrane lipoprotein-sorting protein